MAVGVRRCFCYGFLLVLLSTTLFLYLQRSNDNFNTSHIKRFESWKNRAGKIGSSVHSNINHILHEEDRLKIQTEELLQVESLNGTKIKGIIALLQYLINARNHKREAGVRLLLPSTAVNFQDLERTVHRPKGYKVGSLYEQKPACVIPKLDPFAKETRDYLKDVEEHKCYRKDYAVLQKGMLKLKRNGIRDVVIRYIRRAKNDDFINDYSDPFSILEHEVKLRYLGTGEYHVLICYFIIINKTKYESNIFIV